MEVMRGHMRTCVCNNQDSYYESMKAFQQTRKTQIIGSSTLARLHLHQCSALRCEALDFLVVAGLYEICSVVALRS